VPELARQLRRAATEPVAAHDALIRMIRAWERGDHRPSERYELLYRKLGLIPPTDIDPPDAQAARTASLEDDDPVRRRTFIELTGISAATALLAIPSGTRPPLDTEPLALALTAQMTGIAPEPAQEPPNIAALTLSVTRARAHYQACRYAELITRLPRLLAQLDAACNFLDGDDKLRAYTLAADAYHLTAGILLKTGDHSLAHLATDRSMTAALASQDPLTVGASARIVTHTLASSGHLPAAIATAQNHSQRVDRQTGTHTPESLSVYGSVLLRGALAAAQHDDRTTAHEMLTEASGTARRLGTDANLRGTALGPVNAQLHQVNIAVTLGDVNIAVTLGDAGTAIDLARQIDPAAITVTERLPACSSTLPRHSSSGAVQTGLHHVSRRRADRPAGTHRPGPGPRPGPQPRRPGPARHPPRRCAPRRPDRRLRMTPNGRVLTAVVCGAGPAVATGTLVKLACDRGWMVQVVATRPRWSSSTSTPSPTSRAAWCAASTPSQARPDPRSPTPSSSLRPTTTPSISGRRISATRTP